MTLTESSHQSYRAVVIAGPTGSGKSALAMALSDARCLRGVEIICADSRQIYREMDIGTDKPSPEDRARVPHHMLDIVTPDSRYSAGAYARAAFDHVRRIREKGGTPLVVGGTGLYIRALIYGLADVPAADEPLRKRLKHLLENKGPEHLHRILAQRDPERAASIRTGDAYRIIRALEIISSYPGGVTPVYQNHGFRKTNLETEIYVLNPPREHLYEKINQRVDRMIRRGLENEVRALIRRYGPDAPGLSGIGYRQMVAYIRGEIPLEETIRRIKRDTRRFAKRQLTWFRKEKNALWMKSGSGETLEKIRDILAEKIRRFMG